jgi:RNA-directed DNA polymerase
VISPLLSNIYLNEVDQMLERAKQVTQNQQWTHVEYARFADDMVILVSSHRRQQWLRRAVEKRVREELTKLEVEVNEEKSRKVDLEKGGSFGFLGFEFRRIRSRRGRWMPLRIPKTKKRTALLGTLRVVFRRFQSQPVGRLIEEINPILRGWVNYFAMGHSSRCFAFIRNWFSKRSAAIWRAPASVEDLDGNGGVGNGFTGRWVCLTSISFRTGPLRQRFLSHRSHNPGHEGCRSA